MLLDELRPDRTVIIGTELSPSEEKQLVEFLYKNTDAFAWSTADLHGVDHSVIEHRLDVDKVARPKKLKLRKMLEEVTTIRAEVQRLLDAGVIREVKYTEWTSRGFRS